MTASESVTDAAADAPRTVDTTVVARLREFAAHHGSGTVAVIEHLGRVGARIVLVAPSGEFGDVLAESVDAASDACQAAGVAVQDWDRELTSRVTPTATDRRRMASDAS